jgi:hypothetical protein
VNVMQFVLISQRIPDYKTFLIFNPTFFGWFVKNNFNISESVVKRFIVDKKSLLLFCVASVYFIM